MALNTPLAFPDLMRYAQSVQPIYVMDIETTGLTFEHEIVELGVHNIGTGETWQTYVKPTRTRANDTAHITGITDDMVADSPTIEEALIEMDNIAPLDNALIVGHNAIYFDVPRINHARRNAYTVSGEIDTSRVIDTLYLAHKVIPWGGITDYKLQTLIDFYDLPGTQDHRAGSDCEFTARVLSRLLESARSLAVPPASVGDVLAMSREPRVATRQERELRRLLVSVRKALEAQSVSDVHRQQLVQAYEDMYFKCYQSIPDLRSL